MKKVIFVFLILHFFLITANAQWVVVSDTSFNNAVEVFADNGTFLYAAIPGLGLYKTSDLGQSWYSSFFHIDDRVANCLAVKDSLVFIANDSGLYKSTNYGDNWIKLNLGPNCLYASSVIFKNNYLFAGTYFGIKRSTDLGANWILINNEINWSYGNIQYFTFSNNILYVAIDFSYNLKIFKSTNFGDLILYTLKIIYFYVERLKEFTNQQTTDLIGV